MILSVIFVTSLILESIFGVATVANAAEPTIAIRMELEDPYRASR